MILPALRATELENSFICSSGPTNYIVKILTNVQKKKFSQKNFKIMNQKIHGL